MCTPCVFLPIGAGAKNHKFCPLTPKAQQDILSKDATSLHTRYLGIWPIGPGTKAQVLRISQSPTGQPVRGCCMETRVFYTGKGTGFRWRGSSSVQGSRTQTQPAVTQSDTHRGNHGEARPKTKSVSGSVVIHAASVLGFIKFFEAVGSGSGNDNNDDRSVTQIGSTTLAAHDLKTTEQTNPPNARNF